MTIGIEAIYEHGIFRPIQPVGLDEGQQVVISVQTLPQSRQDVAEQLARWRAVYEGLSEADIAEIESVALDRSQFIPDRNGKRA